MSEFTPSKTTDLLNVKAYDFDLPEPLIARYPLKQRSASRLLYVPADKPLADKQFTDLPDLLQTGDLLVFNDTKVMKARLFGQKDTGGKIEVLVERLLERIVETLGNDADVTQGKDNVALCHVKASKAPKVGQTLQLANGAMQAEVLGRQENLFVLAFSRPILPDLEQYGELPIPPYFNRRADETDNERYQTVFHDPAKQASVASPTASLHFDDTIFKRLTAKGIDSAFVTLHVGAGTFAPVKSEDLSGHVMHSEYAHLPDDTADKIKHTKSNGGRVIAVGTTVTRVLETAYQKTVRESRQDSPSLQGWSGDTDIFIYPGFEFGVIDALITNFHLPKSTLLMLVSAFAGKSQIDEAYAHAIANQYRFFSYGDAMFLEKNQN